MIVFRIYNLRFFNALEDQVNTMLIIKGYVNQWVT